MRIALSPRVVVPFVFGVVIIVALLGYANVGRVLAVVSTFQPIHLLLFFALILGYEGLRAAQWSLFLRTLDPDEPWRASVMSYMGGEMAKVLPGGQYFQTYLLRQARGFPIACSAAATTVIIWLEVVVTLAILLGTGLARWAWVRPTAVALLVGIGLIVVAMRRRPLTTVLVRLARRHERLRPLWAIYDSFAGCATTLLGAAAIVPATLLSAGYILLAAMGLWTIAGALGVAQIGFTQALAVYCFSLGIGLIIPIPIDLGLTELSGLAALVAFGVSQADAVTVMLLQRVLSSVLTGGIALVSLALLRRQVVAAISPGSPSSQ